MSSPTLLSPVLPSELLTYVLNHHAHPTTLMICSSRSDFLASLGDDIKSHIVSDQQAEQETGPSASENFSQTQTAQIGHTLLSLPLYQVAISKHIRTVYVPTVTHLRAYFSVFSPQDSKTTVFPAHFDTGYQKQPHIIIYGVLNLHRDTSEWSAQGIGDTAAAIVEIGHRLGWQVALIEPRTESHRFEDLLKEKVPILSGGVRRTGLDSEEGVWSGRTVDVGRVLGRWFKYRRRLWDMIGEQQT